MILCRPHEPRQEAMPPPEGTRSVGGPGSLHPPMLLGIDIPAGHCFHGPPCFANARTASRLRSARPAICNTCVMSLQRPGAACRRVFSIWLVHFTFMYTAFLR